MLGETCQKIKNNLIVYIKNNLIVYIQNGFYL